MTPNEAEEILGLAPGAPLESIERAFRKVARATHPDLLLEAGPDELRAAAERFGRAQAARDLLRDELTRPAFAILTGPYAGAASASGASGSTTTARRTSGFAPGGTAFAPGGTAFAPGSGDGGFRTAGDARPFADPIDDIDGLPDDPAATLADLAADPSQWAPPPAVDDREDVVLSPLPEEPIAPVQPTGDSYWMPPTAAEGAGSGHGAGRASRFAPESADEADSVEPGWHEAEPAVSSWVPDADETLSTAEVEVQRVTRRRRREKWTIALGAAIAVIGIVVGGLIAANPQLFEPADDGVTLPAAHPQKRGDDAPAPAHDGTAMAFESASVDTPGAGDCTVGQQCWIWTIASTDSCDGTAIATVAFSATATDAPSERREYPIAGLGTDAPADLIVQHWPSGPPYAVVESLSCR
ncbi:DnaJ domain-containing protein [Schumannella sp. 10F1B-5-1]|uniref:DnaJ domain-containing protein n=1 Tax=Schumannella sp. 10F1B-5-1 TaxID=2590780 RepID=UPI0011325862|nr:DnaJ domain-containing protein [Schumannella sp. 10F1B-5-1]TPW72275.1 hypothetical protein FJ658_08365 [Schumannella sp. 10F1B-5-1]